MCFFIMKTLKKNPLLFFSKLSSIDISKSFRRLYIRQLDIREKNAKKTLENKGNCRKKKKNMEWLTQSYLSATRT